MVYHFRVMTFTYYNAYQGFIQDFLVGGKKFVGHCHSVMHEYETTNFQVLSMRLYRFLGRGGKLRLRGGIPGPPTLCMKLYIVISYKCHHPKWYTVFF